MGNCIAGLGVVAPDANRGRSLVACGSSIERTLLSTDAVGLMALTLTNVVVGSVCEIERTADNSQAVTPQTAASSTVVFSVPVYPSGDPKNTLRIKVRKGSATPYYQPLETQVTATLAAQSIFINQLSDE